jgi:hypothetical protein
MALHYFTPRARTRGTEGTRGTVRSSYYTWCKVWRSITLHQEPVQEVRKVREVRKINRGSADLARSAGRILAPITSSQSGLSDRAKWADQVAATFQLPQVPGDINTATEDRVDIAINRPSTIPGIAFSPSATSVQANRLFPPAHTGCRVGGL